MTEVIWKPHEGAQTFALQVSDVYECLYGGA